MISKDYLNYQGYSEELQKLRDMYKVDFRSPFGIRIAYNKRFFIKVVIEPIKSSSRSSKIVQYHLSSSCSFAPENFSAFPDFIKYLEKSGNYNSGPNLFRISRRYSIFELTDAKVFKYNFDSIVTESFKQLELVLKNFHEIVTEKIKKISEIDLVKILKEKVKSTPTAVMPTLLNNEGPNIGNYLSSFTSEILMRYIKVFLKYSYSKIQNGALSTGDSLFFDEDKNNLNPIPIPLDFLFISPTGEYIKFQVNVDLAKNLIGVSAYSISKDYNNFYSGDNTQRIIMREPSKYTPEFVNSMVELYTA